jgi:hypothetical protein
MNPRTNRRTSFTQEFPEAEQGRVPLIGYPENLQNIYGLGMTQAIELSKSAFSTAVCLNSCLMDFYRHFFWYPMGLEYWFEAQKEAFAKWMELGTQSFGIFAPQVESRPGRDPRAERVPRQAPAKAESKDIEEGIDVVVDAFDDEILA